MAPLFLASASCCSASGFRRIGTLPSRQCAESRRGGAAPYTFGIWTGWSDPAEDDANIAWTREFYEAMKPHGAGAYVNYLSEDEGSRVGEAYGENFARLVEVKKAWDPDNLFRMNQNIAPGG